MIKNLLVSACLMLACFSSFAQSRVEYLEVTAQVVEGAIDTTQRTVAYIIAIADYNVVDSLMLKLTDGDEQPLYADSNTLSGWASAFPYRTEGSTLYLTIDAGTYYGLRAFDAWAYTVSGGMPYPGKPLREYANHWTYKPPNYEEILPEPYGRPADGPFHIPRIVRADRPG